MRSFTTHDFFVFCEVQRPELRTSQNTDSNLPHLTACVATTLTRASAGCIMYTSRCGFKKGPFRPLFQSKSRRWRGSHKASPSHPPGGNHEYRTAETRTQADMGIKARAPEAPTLHALTPWHSPTRSRRPNPCPVAVAGSLHPTSNFPSTASCTRPL